MPSLKQGARSNGVKLIERFQFTFLPVSSLLYLNATYIMAFPPSFFPFQRPFNPTAMPVAWILFVSGWVFQFVGHGLFEKRRPRLMDNLFQGESRLAWLLINL